MAKEVIITADKVRKRKIKVWLVRFIASLAGGISICKEM